MRTSRLLAAFFVLASVGPVAALDLGASTEAREEGEEFESVKDALRAVVRDLNAGNKSRAVKALEFAANEGHPVALWKLGRMYAEGDGVARDDLRAFEYFSRIADDYADEASDSSRAGVVASAFTALGGYHLDGIKNSYVAANPERAAEMFKYAASYFGDPNAQFRLGRLYQDGVGLERDPRKAARWFNLAAEKGHRAAQAHLGQLLINGQGVPRQRARGLMWLTLAKQAADPKREAWISAMHAEALDGASESDRRSAAGFMEQYQAKKR